MKLTKVEKQTMKTYDSHAIEWALKHSTERFWGKEMDRFGELLPQGKVLEIGSGGGRDAKELLSKGYEYTGTDVSRGLLDEAKKANPDTTFLQQSVYDLDFPDDTFDGFWASAVLLHIPQKRLNDALVRIHSVVKNGGIGFISIKQGDGEMIEEDEPNIEGKRIRFFTYWQDAEFQEALVKNGFEVIESRVRPMCKRTTWLVYFVKVKK